MKIELSYSVALSVLFFVVINFEYVESGNAQAVCLPIYSTLQNIQLVGLGGFIAGWGLTGDSDTPSDVLRAVVVRTISNSECVEIYRRAGFTADIFLTDHKFCSGDEGEDSCRGDSGGPIIHPGLYKDKPRYIQYGIVSYGSEECEASVPGVYMKLVKYLNWILDNIKP